MDEEFDVVLSIFGVGLDIPSPYFEGGRSGSRVCKRTIKCPYSTMLSSGERSKCAVEGTSREGKERLLHQKLQVHFPDPRHFVQEDQGAFVEGVDLAKLGRECRGVQFSDMLGPEIKILFSVSQGTLRENLGRCYHSP